MIRSVAAVVIAGSVLVSAQQLPSEPQRQFGTSITGAFEGWFANADGSRSFLVGYLNRNTSQALDIPMEMFTVMFAIPRVSGWLAQWQEMLQDPDQKISRPRQIFTGARQREFVEIGKR